MARGSDASQRRKLDMHKMPNKCAITVQCGQLDINPEQAAELLRHVSFVAEVTLRSDHSLVVSYGGCTLERIKQNVFNHLKQCLV